MHFLENMRAGVAWSDEERLLLEQVRRVCAETIAPNAAALDKSGDFPTENMARLNDLGLNGIFVPEAYGGTPMGYRVYLECVKLISEACASTGIIYATNFHAMKPLIDLGSEEQRARLLPRIAGGGMGALAITEATAGSDATGMRTRFTEDGDEIIVEGAKLFISNGDVADLILLFGKWAGEEDSKRAISALIVERDAPGLVVGRKEDKMGHRAASTVELRFEECRVPRANLLAGPGEGLPVLLTSLNKSRPSVAAHAIGIARAALADMVDYMNTREQSGRRVIDFQGNQFMLADLASELAMVETWLDHVARRIEGGCIEAGDAHIGVEASIAKMRASDLAMRMATEAVQMHGGYGYISEYRPERLMRDAKITQIWEGTNQVHRQLIGRNFKQR